ncbi:MAG: LPS biosynthesis protein WbpP [Bacteroidetes bacterium HGW-Bacteroidetes-12]|nr:MAG: LPS biosynthesis protein WbpP [Bacteroidetes bacterium HGW-Bacteroidetes-12]
MYNKPFHNNDISKLTFLVTGGAGFIGSNIVTYLIKYHAGKVIVLDNLSNGYLKNIQPFLGLSNFEFIEGDITDFDTCQKIVNGVDYISHQAALGSVPRSIENPISTHLANATGFLNILTAAKDAKVKRVVFASSSSVYGDSKELPKVEDKIGNQLSPYAVSKRTKELYANVFALTYNLDVVGLRYFNVFGPNQSPNGAYAAAIPLFMEAVLTNKSPFINGDGEQSRDFTFVENVVQANIKAMFTDKEVKGKVMNIAFGGRTTINDLFFNIRNIVGNKVEPTYREERKGDVRDSLADISLAKELIDYNPDFSIEDGLKITIDWFRKPNRF